MINSCLCWNRFPSSTSYWRLSAPGLLLSPFNTSSLYRHPDFFPFNDSQVQMPIFQSQKTREAPRAPTPSAASPRVPSNILRPCPTHILKKADFLSHPCSSDVSLSQTCPPRGDPSLQSRRPFLSAHSSPARRVGGCTLSGASHLSGYSELLP